MKSFDVAGDIITYESLVPKAALTTPVAIDRVILGNERKYVFSYLNPNYMW